jgi:hypothetical protein
MSTKCPNGKWRTRFGKRGKRGGTLGEVQDRVFGKPWSALDEFCGWSTKHGWCGCNTLPKHVAKLFFWFNLLVTKTIPDIVLIFFGNLKTLKMD